MSDAAGSQPASEQSRIGQRYRPTGDHPVVRPKDAASLLLIDRNSSRPRVLMGMRGEVHVFMPNLYVFPGGRRDSADSRVPVSNGLHMTVEKRLLKRAGSSMTRTRARALAVTAIRETQEEAGILIGASGAVGQHEDWREFAAAGLAPDLANLRYIARAITPPRQSRRFDTRFFACFTDECGIDPKDVRDSRELHDLRWVDLAAPSGMDLPRITRSVLGDLEQALANDNTLSFDHPVPFYFVRSGIFRRETID